MTSSAWKAWRPGSAPALPGLAPVVGHRGAALHAPENTMVSIRKAHALGARWVEIDVKLSRDGVPFLLHDESLERTTSGSGPAAGKSWQELAALDAGGWFGEAFRGEPLLSLEALAALLLELGMAVNVEIKPCPGREEETALVAGEMLARLWPKDGPVLLFSSFKRASLAALQRSVPHFPRGLLVEALPEDWAQAMQDLGCTTLHPSHRRLSPGELRLLKEQGVPVLLYTVNEAERARELLEAGADAVITDAPERILPLVGAGARA
ncbi:glycerophosphodiester phosphodiesterase [Marinimicrococcus flavescens]|uniref:Glycerophosphodiester phosphodiesterase n=1 Tax=Marinimicrococcus flavescens TaxID=3031815 RepID=A0AAP3XSR6_9PROT|nr:glycerophosphodiester phosphodiesterase [Marinimicrococcus flavescens]